MIEANEGLTENTSINNTASIYFDSNPPIVTNTTENLMVSELPVAIDWQTALPEFFIIPNPTTGIFQIKGTQSGQYKILNVSGQVVKNGVLPSDYMIDISEQSQGVYFISIETKGRTDIRRIVKL